MTAPRARWIGPIAASLVALVAAPLAAGALAGASASVPPMQGVPPPSSLGKGEGALDLIAWEGYAQPQWVTPFQRSTGCKVSITYAGSSGAMVSLMANGGGHRYDVVSAAGDADLRLIYGGTVRPINIKLIASWRDFSSFLQAPGFNTVNGYHYGVSYEFGKNVLLYSTKGFPTPPTSWSVLYSSKDRGKITIPNNPIQLADAALYLSRSRHSLRITDPYELTRTQFNAAVSLLRSQRPLVKAYWDLARQEISMFKHGTAVVGEAWPYQANVLAAGGASAADTVPVGGSTGRADSWLLAANAPHPNCAYRWLQYVSTPRVQAEEAIVTGETPANALACPILNELQGGGCAAHHGTDPERYFTTIKLWKTPLATCDSGRPSCVPFSKWQQAWAQITR